MGKDTSYERIGEKCLVNEIPPLESNSVNMSNSFLVPRKVFFYLVFK